MAYATALDLLDKVGATELAQVGSPDARLDPEVLERVLRGQDTTGDDDEQVALAEAAQVQIDDELDTATARMNTRLRVRYRLPFVDPQPVELVGWCLDIGRYGLHDIAATEEVRNRYKDAMAALDLIAAGKASLDVPDDGSATASSGSPVIAPNVPRTFDAVTLAPYVRLPGGGLWRR